MNKNKEFFNKTIVIGILILFIETGIVSTISGYHNNTLDTISLTFYIFDTSGTIKFKKDILNNIAEEIYQMFEDLKNRITGDPFSDETQTLKNDFVEILDANGFITQGLSKDDVFSLLNPRWLQRIGNNNSFAKVNIPHSKISTFVDNFIPGPFSHSGSAFFCSIAGYGYGILFSPIMLPRPRLASLWTSYIGAKFSAANLFTGRGFIASGPQFGITLGFIGIGLSITFPGEPASFGFVGYALSTFVQAENIETFP